MNAAVESSLSQSFREHYGVQISSIGEDGEMVILGHWKNRRRVVAAIAAYHREIYAEKLSADLDAGNMLADVEEQLADRWAVIALPCGGHMDGREPSCRADCAQCRDAAMRNPGGEWFMFWDRKSSEPDAFPVTVFGAWS